MPLIKDVSFDSWKSFKSDFALHLCGAEPYERGRFIFRGHSDASWRLSSSFDRMFTDLPNTGERQQLAVAVYKELETELKRSDTAANMANNPNALLPLAQHYGVPTRLLDWTENPFIAAFFAYEGSLRGNSQYVAIWVLDSSNPVWSEVVGVGVISPEPSGNIRLRNQSGKFTVSRTQFECLEDYVTYGGGDGIALYKYVLPSSDALHALAELDAMGINHMNLFSGVEGAGWTAIYRAVAKQKLGLK